jgi:prepilin-type N-terminal cleavage/methylation domain-containing protein
VNCQHIDRHRRLPVTRRAFTLTEMLIVVICLSLLMALVAGGYEAVRDEAHRTTCVAQLKKIHGALYAYAQRSSGYLPDTGAASPLAGPVPLDGYHFPDTWDSRGSPFWPAEKHTGNLGNLYLLIRLGLALPEDFVCPATGDRPAFGPFTDTRFSFMAFKPGSPVLTDEEREFLQTHATRHCSYSYQNLLGHRRNNPAIAEPAAGALLLDHSPPDLAILADHNPYTELQGEARPCRDSDAEPLANSLNHQGRGQNVLYLNGSILWSSTPECGATLDDGARDNIYRPAVGQVTDPRNIPRHVRDSYLVP